MDHVWDHFDYTNDLDWWKSQGWPLVKVRHILLFISMHLGSFAVKGVAGFHLDKLIPDLHFNDSTLVVNPCNSPEQAPITLGASTESPMRTVID